MLLLIALLPPRRAPPLPHPCQDPISDPQRWQPLPQQGWSPAAHSPALPCPAMGLLGPHHGPVSALPEGWWDRPCWTTWGVATAPGPRPRGSPWPTQRPNSGVTKRQPTYKQGSKVLPGGRARALGRVLDWVISKNPFQRKLICYSKNLQSDRLEQRVLEGLEEKSVKIYFVFSACLH